MERGLLCCSLSAPSLQQANSFDNLAPGLTKARARRPSQMLFEHAEPGVCGGCSSGGDRQSDASHVQADDRQDDRGGLHRESSGPCAQVYSADFAQEDVRLDAQPGAGPECLHFWSWVPGSLFRLPTGAPLRVSALDWALQRKGCAMV